MTPRETLPELIHRLVEEKGRTWVENELSYAPQVVDAHLATYAAGRSGRPAPTSRVTREPLHQAQIARHLGVRADTLNRALRNDPEAPAPAPGTDGQRWLYAEVHTWWPRRRKRGHYPRPARATVPRTPGEDPA
ncbi:hypothetical protein [Streptomyces sp. MMBL 11-1]|uniref:hypothetical protein n=1 Tax=Streptomyces sp. MMBL 11-1 TaxID=3026420 RepID=UPI00235E0E56|nr:hypothetical protein [Streptomyces sp. MMBL 11-1]